VHVNQLTESGGLQLKTSWNHAGSLNIDKYSAVVSDAYMIFNDSCGVLVCGSFRVASAMSNEHAWSETAIHFGDKVLQLGVA
jgi:hypothetical protein